MLKWIGNKQRFAHEIISMFPERFGTYFEPFLGSGAVLGSLSPNRAVASDAFGPLMEIWDTLKHDHKQLEKWYTERWKHIETEGKEAAYEKIKASYNANPNGADFVFLSRACYGGVVRFRQADGYMSTPCGPHNPISPHSFTQRVKEWIPRVRNAEFVTCDFEESMSRATAGDLIYCDPPYSFSQTILYGAQSFSIERLLNAITHCKERGVYVVLSIDGSKKSGNMICDVPIPTGLFEREVAVNVGRSMLKRFQMEGQTLEEEVVADRLLLTY
ncbi:site-specific DNA-methyltransferase (adenine-specific) (plasmid) [Bryobacterales bacterium F-183]|nr:site-specific DNA-methyltransferase (adenine-specific) [Bryobacterales bacterium F-183]